MASACNGEAEKVPEAPNGAAERVIQGDPARPIPALLAALSKGSTQPLTSCGLEVELGDARYAFALTKRGGQMRREAKTKTAGDESAGRIDKRFENKLWTSDGLEADGSRRWRAVPAAEVKEIEAQRLLLGSVLAWDLIADPEDASLTRRATWFRESQAPVIHREFDEEGRLTLLSIDGERWRVDGWHEERGAMLPKLTSETTKLSLRYIRVSIGSRFFGDYFKPSQHGEDDKSALLTRSPGSEEAVYDRALLEHVPSTQYIEADVGDTWPARFEKLMELGNKLGALKLLPNGLPSYLPGKMRIFIRPEREGGPVRAPTGYELKTRAAGHAVVIRVRSMPFRDARAKLGDKLRAYAKKQGYVPDGEILLRPKTLPPGDAPAEGDPVELWAVLRIR